MHGNDGGRCCNSHQCTAVMAGSAPLLCCDGEHNFLFFLFGTFKSLQTLLLRARERKRKRKSEKERERALEPILGYVTTRLVSLFTVSPILALLVGKGVTTLAPSSNPNTNSKKKFKNSKLKKIYYFQH
jgi:hypothetical protein